MTKDVFVVTVRYREKDLMQVGMVYATLTDQREREVLDGLQDVVQRHPGPLVLLGGFNKDVLRRPAYQDRLRTWGCTAYPTGWTWSWRGAGARGHERSMRDFIMAPSDMQVARVQLGPLGMCLVSLPVPGPCGGPSSPGCAQTRPSRRSGGNHFGKNMASGHTGTSWTWCCRFRRGRKRPWRFWCGG